MPSNHGVLATVTDRPEANASFFDRCLDQYYQLPEYALWRAIELRLLARYQFDRPMLDLGCGDGSFVHLLFDKAPDVGFDVDAVALREAERRRAYRLVLRADAGRMPFATASFGSLLSNCVMEHIPHYREVVREIGRVVRPGGRVFLTVPSPKFHSYLHYVDQAIRRGDPAAAEAYTQQIDRQLAHHYYLGPDQWGALLGEAGIDLEEVTWYLPQETLATWNVLEETFAVRKIFGVPLYGLLGSPRWGALRAVPRTIVTAALGSRLRRLYRVDARPGEGAALCLAGRRREGAIA